MVHYGLALFLLMVGFHFIADFPLQGDFLAKGKAGLLDTPECKVSPWCLIAHGAIHGLFVGMTTATIEFGMAEFICHTMIDLFKIKKKISFNTDQYLHIFCKAVWAFCAVYALHSA